MDRKQKPSFLRRLTTLVTGRNRNIDDLSIFRNAYRLPQRLEELVAQAEASCPALTVDQGTDSARKVNGDPRDKTAILLVSGFNGIGLHTLFGIIRLFGGTFKNFVFVQVGITDAGNLKDPREVSRREAEVRKELDRYIRYMQCHGYFAVGYSSIGADIVDELAGLIPEILGRFPNTVLFRGELVFPKTPFLSGMFHNYTLFAVQRKFYSEGIPVVILPIRV